MANIEVEPLTIHLGGVGSADIGKIVTAALDNGFRVVAATAGNVSLHVPSGPPTVLIAALKFINDMGNATIRDAVLRAFDAAEAPPGASTSL